CARWKWGYFFDYW
nr:immunoglobulin heavy chain junction region [Mus musculus]